MWFRALENECRLANPPAQRRTEFDNAERIEIRMFRVVEGEAILLIFDQTRCWLIDGGNTSDDKPNEQLAEALHSYLLDRSLVLEACVASHAHFDHMGAYETLLTHGLPGVADPVRVIRSTPAWKDDNDFLIRYKKIVNRSNNKVHGDVIDAPEDFRDPPVDTTEEIMPGLTARFLAGGGKDEYFSLLMHLTFGGARILFTGDTTQSYERRLITDINDDTAWRADVYKVSHHGSEDSNSKDSLKKPNHRSLSSPTTTNQTTDWRKAPKSIYSRPRSRSGGSSRPSTFATSLSKPTATPTKVGFSTGSPNRPRLNSLRHSNQTTNSHQPRSAEFRSGHP